ncbi:MAG: PEP/pyruvate-binding domain-containing protein [Dehalococcoidia bacterium]
MTTFVRTLAEAGEDAARVGGKAAGLYRLARGGLPIPPGFVIDADGHRAFLRANGLETQIEGLMDSAEPDKLVLERLRAAAWPDDLRSGVARAYEALRAEASGAPVAVRSSATAEDSAGASFAGQHITLLNVDGLEAVLDGVLACWASLYSALAFHYRRARDVQDDGPAMAVVVQALVPADASGVAFTIDPVSGDHDVVVIEGALGLGEGVVAGIVTPDHYAVRKSDDALVRREVTEQHVRIVPAPGGGTREEELAPEEARASVLSDQQAIEIARYATRIEEFCGVPQDIEWAISGGRIYLLQARPVTTVDAPPPPPGEPLPAVATTEAGASDEPEEWVSEFDTPTGPDTIWTAANVQEVLPDQLSPLNVSMTDTIIERFGTEPMKRVGVKLRTKDPFSGYFYGKAFLNVTMMIEAADQTPFGSADALMDQYFGQARDPNAEPERPSFGKVLRYALILPRILWFSIRMPAEIKRSEEIVADFEREMIDRPFEQRSDGDLIRSAKDGLIRGGEVAVTHVSAGGLTGGMFELLRAFTEQHLGDENGVLQAKLCTGLSGVESAQPAYELWDISRVVLASDVLREAFVQTDARPGESESGAAIERRLASLVGEDVAGFQRRLGVFLARHGHRSVMEAEISAKSWDEDLPTVLSMVRNYLHAHESSDPRKIEARQRAERETATKESSKKLVFWRRPIFRYVLNQAQQWVVSREHTKALFMRSVHRGRKLTREIGRRLVARGLLDDAFDLYYLTWEEAKALFAGRLSREDSYAAIRRRLMEEKRNKGVVLPETFTGRPTPLRASELVVPDTDILRGIAVSPGRVTGRARVIMDPRINATIEPGEILVAPVTDAGWTPLFVAAAGIVVDIGGTLSHGSTVAREYGLPAVVNVKHATRMIRTGQTITVDGTRGEVVLEAES